MLNPISSSPRSLDIKGIARVCHEANRAYCMVIGDDSQQSWTFAPQWQKDSAVDGVEHALKGATPEQSHESWLATKRKDGWVYGDLKDPDRKTHPCMLEYDKLPAAQKLKDYLFTAIVNAFCAPTGPKI